MQRALVLGGGGVIGVAWETGLVKGFEAAGLPLTSMDAIVGTSAGALVGCMLLTGTLKTPAERDDEGTKIEVAPMDFSKIDPQAMGRAFTIWKDIEHTTPEQAASIGAIARTQNRAGEDAWVENIKRSTGANGWPAGDLRICSVATESGERRVFDRNAEVPIERALAASSAVPGLFPSVEIRGELCMDGQVHSSTNADLLLADKPREVLIAMPTNERNARGIGKHARRAVEAEIEALEAAGIRVSFRTPEEAHVARMGSSLMDPAGVADAYAIGLETGQAWATELLG